MRRGFLSDARGAISMITALAGVAIIGATAFAIDMGWVFLESRRLQGTADLAAIAAAQDPSRARTLALATAEANDWPDIAALEATTGVYTPDPEVAPDRRFAAGARPNAAHVRISAETPLFFGRLFMRSDRLTITREATAAQTRWAAFQIGSRLLSFQGGLANNVLSALFGSQISLSVMDYNALASANVDLFAYTSALRTRLDLQAATFGDTLSHRVETGEALQALADVLQTTDSRAAAAIRALADSRLADTSTTALRQLIDLGPYARSQDATFAGSTSFQVNALDLANAIAEIAGGDRQVRLNLTTNVPGLTIAQAWLAIGERPNNSPWLTITNDNDVIIRTAQTRLYIEASTPITGLVGSLAQVRVPILTELASGQAKLAAIACDASGSRRAVTLSVAPSIGTLSLGEIDVNQLDNFQHAMAVTPAHVIRAGLLRVDARAQVRLGGEQWQDVRFSEQDIRDGVIKTVKTRDATQATVSSLLGQTQISILGLSLGLGSGPVTNALRGTLTRIAAPLDNLLNGLTDILGVGLGEADVRVNGVRCGGAALVT